MIIPVVLGLAGLAAYKVHKRKTGLTPEKQAIFAGAMNSLSDPDKLRGLADQFHGEGFPQQAELLRKRAKLRELPKDIQGQRREVFRKGMSSMDTNKIEQLAQIYEEEGCTGAAECLRLYAKGVRATQPEDIEAVAKSLETKKGPVAKAAAGILRSKNNGT